MQLSSDSKRTVLQEPEFLKEAFSLNRVLSGFSAEELCSLMKMSPALGEQTIQYLSNFHKGSLREALFAYRGTSFQSLDAPTLPEYALGYAEKHLRILSGMYGCLRPLDGISPYRLEMKTPLVLPGDKNLYTFWKQKINASLLSSTALGERDSVIINLASGEYSRVIDAKGLNRKLITLHFKERKGEQYRTVGMYAKAARGTMLRRILEKQLADPEEIKRMKVNCYEYRKILSDDENWVFSR